MIVSKCAEEGLRPLRFGREHRIREDLRQYGCEEQIRTHPLQASLKHWSDEEDRLRDRKKEISDLLDGKKAVFADLGTESTGMSIEEQDELRAEHGESKQTSGVPSRCMFTKYHRFRQRRTWDTASSYDIHQDSSTRACRFDSFMRRLSGDMHERIELGNGHCRLSNRFC